MRAIRTIIQDPLILCVSTGGPGEDWLKLMNTSGRIIKFAMFETDFLPNQIVFAKSATARAYNCV